MPAEQSKTNHPFESILNLSREQIDSVNPDINVVVSAGAGTGKTLVLAIRYLWILKNLCDAKDENVQRIAAMTFSEKAAAEMWDRICSIAFKMFWSTNSAEWFDVYRSLRNASVSTIHSFCRTLLLQHPLKACLDPDFQIEPSKIAVENLTEDFLSDFVMQSDRNLKIFIRLVRRYPRWKIKRILTQLFNKRIIADSAIKKCANATPEQIYEEYEKMWRTMWDTSRKTVVDNIELIKEQSCRKGKVHPLKWGWIIDNIPSRIEPPDAEFFRELKENLSGLRLNEISEAMGNIREIYSKVSDNLDELSELAEDVVQLAGMSVEFEKFVWFGYDKYRTVDFNELILRARELMNKLTDKELMNILPHHLLLDEFQDTSSLQWELVDKMNETAETMFFVGDEKQSIYRFQGADVSIVRKGEKIISERKGRAIPLPVNKRTKPRLLRLLNDIFRSILPSESEISYEARFQELFPDPEFKGEDKSALGLVSYEEKGKYAETSVRLIKSLAAGTYPWGEDEPAQLKDIMVLAHRRDAVFEIIKALRSNSIPAIPLVERGFYYADEVKAIVFLCEFLADRRNNGALYWLLQSAVFNAPKDELSKIEFQKRDGTLWERIHRLSDNKKIPALKRAAEILDGLISSAEALRPDFVIDKFLTTEGILSSLCASGKEVALANVQKIVAYIRSLAVGQGLNFEEISAILQAEREANETGFAIPIETGNVVRVSTIHSAKGLESKIVILIGSEFSKKGRDDVFNIEREIPFQFVPKQSIEDRKTIVHYYANKSDIDKTDAEYLRLFYVAMTRASDYLFIVNANENKFFTNGIDETLTSLQQNTTDGLFKLQESDIKAPADFGTDTDTSERPAKDMTSQKISPSGVIVLSVTEAARRIVTLPETIETNYPNAESESHLEWGNLVHKLLANAPFESAEEAIAIASKLSNDERFLKIAGSFAMSKLNEKLQTDAPAAEVPLWLRINNLLLNGYIDVLLTKSPSIWDYKTGKPDPSKNELYSAQINIYRLAVAKWKNIAPEKIQAGIVWIGNENISFVPVPFDSDLEQKLVELEKNLVPF